jgi:S-adenosylmethionine synthetase
MDLRVHELSGPSAARGEVEVVERKGLGHPDTLCDLLAEELSRGLCAFYRERFGRILHHNVDKVLLWGGAARPAFGGGEVSAPFEVYLAGRATTEHEGVAVPLEELAAEGSRALLGRHLHALDVERHVRVHCRVRAGAAELVDVYSRSLANDTSCGVGYAPLTPLERVVLAVERRLNAPETKRVHPALGEDVKVMGVRRGRAIELTISCALIGRHCADLAAYLAAREVAASLALAAARAETELDTGVVVNAADAPERGALFLTVTGTSAEAGDDGEAGRGNRANGLITPYRPMTMESVAGKNPVTHVGKVYNLAAGRVAEALVAGLEGVEEAECRLVSRIGHPVDDPWLVDIVLRSERPARQLRARAERIVRDQLAGGLGS